tara:strand:- start:1979 stop:2257 length:279 start_codon:yes stop_codon:yes gene_type:complete
MKQVILKMIADHMFNEETKGKIITKLNENVDIPIIGEGTEQKILEALYETIEATMKEVLFEEEMEEPMEDLEIEEPVEEPIEEEIAEEDAEE